MSTCSSSLGNFEKRIKSLILSYFSFPKNSAFFCNRLVLISFFCVAFFGSRYWKDFFDFFDINLTKLKNLRVTVSLVSLILAWSLYLSSIFQIFKIGIFVKYSVNFLAIWSLQEINLSPSTKWILECFVTYPGDNSIISYILSIKIAIKILFIIS